MSQRENIEQTLNSSAVSQAKTVQMSSPPLVQLYARPGGPEQPAGCSPQSPAMPGLPAHPDKSRIWSSDGWMGGEKVIPNAQTNFTNCKHTVEHYWHVYTICLTRNQNYIILYNIAQFLQTALAKLTTSNCVLSEKACIRFWFVLQFWNKSI